MPKMIGYARVSTAAQDTDRQQADLLAAGVRRDDLYVDLGVSGGRASRPALDAATAALHAGDTLVVATLDRLGRNVGHMLALSAQLEAQGVALKVLNLGGDVVDTATPMGRMMFTVMAALAQMELDIKTERARDSIAKRRERGGDLGGRRRTVSDTAIRDIHRAVQGGEESTAGACRARGISRDTYYRRAKGLGLD